MEWIISDSFLLVKLLFCETAGGTILTFVDFGIGATIGARPFTNDRAIVTRATASVPIIFVGFSVRFHVMPSRACILLPW